MKLPLKFTLAAFALFFISFAGPVHAQQTETLDLSGPWLTQPGDDIHRGADSVKENTWKQVTLPSSAPSAGFVWYRRHFNIPSDWATDTMVEQKHELILHLGQFRGALNVYLNGYHVQAIGTIPTDSSGTGFISAPSKSDVALGIATEAVVGGQTVDLFNYDKDNVIAFQVYVDHPGGGFTGGQMELEKPGFALYYPYSRTLGDDSGLFDTKNPIKFDVTLGNRTTAGIKDQLTIDAADDEGVPPTNFTAPSGPVNLDSKSETTITYTLTFAQPGFYKISVKLNADNKDLPDDNFVVGYNTLEISTTGTRPADFKEFWNGVIRDATQPTTVTQSASATAPNYVFTGVDGKPVDGWLTMPTNAPGKVPVIIEFPSYNTDFTGPDTNLTGKGVATLRLNIDQSFVGAGLTPITSGADDPHTYAYRVIFGNALRAVASLPASVFDVQRVGVAGVDQGASAALTAAALDPSQIKAVFAADPLFALPQHSIKAATSGPYLDLKAYLSDHPAAAQTLNYFDLTNLAPTISAPVYLQLGLLDVETPPFGSFAVSNEIKSTQTTDIDPNAGHASPNDLAGGLSWLAAHL